MCRLGAGRACLMDPPATHTRALLSSNAVAVADYTCSGSSSRKMFQAHTRSDFFVGAQAGVSHLRPESKSSQRGCAELQKNIHISLNSIFNVLLF